MAEFYTDGGTGDGRICIGRFGGRWLEEEGVQFFGIATGCDDQITLC